MTKDQSKKATKLLGLLCEKGNLTNKEVSLFFKDNDDEANFICKFLKYKGLIRYESNGVSVISIDKTDETKNAFETDLLMMEFMERETSDELKRLEIELANSNIEANELNAKIAAQNVKNEKKNIFATWVNISIGLLNIVLLAIQIWLIVCKS
jgi:hypothetical protein